VVEAERGCRWIVDGESSRRGRDVDLASKGGLVDGGADAKVVGKIVRAWQAGSAKQ
jgi:hypothetical protein